MSAGASDEGARLLGGLSSPPHQHPHPRLRRTHSLPATLSTRHHAFAVSARVRATCAWLSKRTAISFDDLYLRPHEMDALDELRDELVSGGVGLGGAPPWQGLALRDPVTVSGPEAEEQLARELWGHVFAGDAATAATWRESCVCGGGASSPRCPALLSNTAARSDAAAAEPALLLEYPSTPSRAWIALGFQGVDPRTDLRALGASGLAFLVRLFDTGGGGGGGLDVPVYRDRVLCLAVGCARGTELPLAIAALNAQYMLRCHLHLFASPPAMCCCCGAKIRELEYGARSAQSHGGASLRGFARLVGAEGPKAFFHLYAIALLMLAREWRAAADTIDFPAAQVPDVGRAAAAAGAASAATPARRLLCFNYDSGGVPLGDARLLLFPAMLSRVRQRIMSALAGTIDESDATDERDLGAGPLGHLEVSGGSPVPRGHNRRRSNLMSRVPSIASLTEVLLT